MSALSNLDIFGLLMIVSLVFVLPLAWIGGRDDPVEQAQRLYRERLRGGH